MNKPTRLEIFPDELFLELFSYILPVELCHTWHGLNARFNAVLRSVRISFDLYEHSDAATHALNHFAQQTVYIHLHSYYASLNLKQFPNLRSLAIDVKPTDEQIDCIRPQILPQLERLTFSVWWTSSEPLSELIFSTHPHEKNFVQLKVYHLPSLPKYFTRIVSKLYHIQTMILDRVTAMDIHIILSVLVYLRRLKVTVVTGMSDVSHPSHPPLHQQLVELDITMNTFSKLDDLYRLFPRLAGLRHLHVACDSLTESDFRQLAGHLHTHIPWLHRLNCSFKQTHVDDIQVLHSMSPLFRRMACRKVVWVGDWYYHCVTTQN